MADVLSERGTPIAVTTTDETVAAASTTADTMPVEATEGDDGNGNGNVVPILSVSAPSARSQS